MRNAVNYGYVVLLIIAIYNKAWAFALFCGVIILWDIVDHYKEKASKEYIDYLEKEKNYWYKKYMDEKYHKKEGKKIETIVICKN